MAPSGTRCMPAEAGAVVARIESAVRSVGLAPPERDLVHAAVVAAHVGDGATIARLLEDASRRSCPIAHHAAVWGATWTLGWSFAAAAAAAAPYELERLPPRWQRDRTFLSAIGELLPSAAPERRGSVRLQALRPLPVVDVAVNGVGGRMLLDTGAATSVVTPEFAHKAGIPNRPQAARLATAGPQQTIVAVPAVLAELELGTIAAFGVAAVILELPPALGVDGLLAPVDAFRRSVIELDLGNGHLAVGDRQAPAGPALRWSDGAPTVAAHVGEIAVELILDSGAVATVLAPAVADRVAGDGNRLTAAAGLSAGGPVDLWPIGDVDVSLGGIQLSTPAARRRFDVDEWSISAGPDGLLGAPWMSRVRLTIDVPGRVVAVSDRSQPS